MDNFKIKIQKNTAADYKMGNIGKLFFKNKHAEIMIDLSNGLIWTDSFDDFEKSKEKTYHNDNIKNLSDFILKNKDIKEKINSATIKKYAYLMKERQTNEQFDSM